MLSIGSGVWMAWKDSTIELYHAQTVTSMQKIEVKRMIERMISCGLQFVCFVQSCMDLE